MVVLVEYINSVFKKAGETNGNNDNDNNNVWLKLIFSVNLCCMVFRLINWRKKKKNIWI